MNRKGRKGTYPLIRRVALHLGGGVNERVHDAEKLDDGREMRIEWVLERRRGAPARAVPYDLHKSTRV